MQIIKKQDDQDHHVSLIRISDILPWDIKSILPMLSYPGCHVRATYIGCIGTHAHGRQVTSLLC